MRFYKFRASRIIQGSKLNGNPTSSLCSIRLRSSLLAQSYKNGNHTSSLFTHTSSLLTLTSELKSNHTSSLLTLTSELKRIIPLHFSHSSLPRSHACFYDIDNVVAELFTFADDIHIHRTHLVGVFVVVHVVDVLRA